MLDKTTRKTGNRRFDLEVLFAWTKDSTSFFATSRPVLSSAIFPSMAGEFNHFVFGGLVDTRKPRYLHRFNA